MPEKTRALFEQLKVQLHKVIVGQDQVLDEMLVTLLAGGHLLLEGVPGIAKTLMVKALAQILNLKFSRIQATPDMMPADIVGTSVYQMNTGSFSLHRGPVFADLVLADEINRTPPKTQSALLEAMEERQVTIDGFSHALPVLFMVIATQNPIEHEGTYPLPEAQLDRFLMKSVMAYPSLEEELEIVSRWDKGFNPHALMEAGLTPVADASVITGARREIRDTTVEASVQRYLVDIVRRTREFRTLQWGASPRAAVSLLLAAKSAAATRGQTYVTPDDVRDMAKPVLRHRIILRPEAELEGLDADRSIDAVLAGAPVPR
ncbi:MAG: MoxR family ATPase [Acidobacteria bacterium]|nr:MoxR family ATPase [Acidobacteriota bacterium]